MMFSDLDRVDRLPWSEPLYKVPFGFAGRRGYRHGFLPDGGRHVVDWYRRGDRPMVLVMFCARCGLVLGSGSPSCHGGSCLGGCGGRLP